MKYHGISLGTHIEFLWRDIRRETLRFFSTLILNLILYIIIYGFVIGLFGYFIYAFQHQSGSDVAFQIATIAGLIGGLILSAGALVQGKSPFAIHLRRIGILFIVSTLGFILVGLYAPLVNTLKSGLSLTVSKRVFQAGFVIGVVSFSVATGYFASVIPRLWRKNNHTRA